MKVKLPAVITGTLLPTKVTMMNSLKYQYQKLALEMELLYLYLEDIITQDQHDELLKMFSSADVENHVVAVLALESLKKESRENKNSNQAKIT